MVDGRGCCLCEAVVELDVLMLLLSVDGGEGRGRLVFRWSYKEK